MAASWLTVMSSSPSEMCFRAASVSGVTELLELDSEKEEELEGDAGLGSGSGRGEGDGERGGGRGEERGGSSSATDISLQEEKHI